MNTKQKVGLNRPTFYLINAHTKNTRARVFYKDNRLLRYDEPTRTPKSMSTKSKRNKIALTYKQTLIRVSIPS